MQFCQNTIQPEKKIYKLCLREQRKYVAVWFFISRKEFNVYQQVIHIFMNMIIWPLMTYTVTSFGKAFAHVRNCLLKKAHEKLRCNSVKIRFSQKKRYINYAYVLKNGVGRFNIFIFYFYTNLAKSSCVVFA
jgi:hypothetical protein